MAKNQEKETPLTDVEIRNKLNELSQFTHYHEGRLIALNELLMELSNIVIEMQKAYPNQELDIASQLNDKIMSLFQKREYQKNASILRGIQTVHEYLHQLKE